jgi:hypothetical protein
MARVWHESGEKRSQRMTIPTDTILRLKTEI